MPVDHSEQAKVALAIPEIYADLRSAYLLLRAQPAAEREERERTESDLADVMCERERLRAENKTFRENIKYLLESTPGSVIASPDAGHEDLAMSLVILWAKLKTRAEQAEADEAKEKARAEGELAACPGAYGILEVATTTVRDEHKSPRHARTGTVRILTEALGKARAALQHPAAAPAGRPREQDVLPVCHLCANKIAKRETCPRCKGTGREVPTRRLLPGPHDPDVLHDHGS